MSWEWSTFLLILSVLLGGGIVVFLQKINQSRFIKILLSLSGGFLLSIAFVHFIPELYARNTAKVGYFILLGFLIQLILEYFSKGVEHGHIHKENTISSAIPWGLFIALSIHSFLEGIPLEAQLLHENGQLLLHDISTHALHSSASHFEIQGLLLGIILHKVPVAIALMTYLVASKFSTLKAWLILFSFALMAPLGMAFGYFGVAKGLLNAEVILAIVVGMFLHVSTTIIFESTEDHGFNFIKLISILAGVGLAIILG